MKNCLKRTKNTKNHIHITCCHLDRVRTNCFPNLMHICSFNSFLAQKNQNFGKMKSMPRDIIISHTLRYLINVGIKKKRTLASGIFLEFNKKGVKIDVGVRIF